MFEWIDIALVAGLSATLSFWLICATVGMGILTWRYRRRFLPPMTVRDFFDAVLNIGLLLIMFGAAYRQTAATISYVLNEWAISPITRVTTPVHIPASLIGMACFLAWMCFEIFGPAKGRFGWMWVALIGSGIWLGIGVGGR